MKSPLLVVSLVLLLCFAFGCQKQQDGASTNVSPEERDKIVSEVKAAMKSYGDAVGRLDADRTIAHFANEPEFRVCFDNQISNYDTQVSQVRELFASLSTVEGGFADHITVVLLGPGIAAAIAPFRETIIDKAGNRSPVKGTVTWIWGRRGTEWKILYGHAVHEPDTASQAQTQTARVEQELLKLEDEWGNALIKHDPAPLDKLLADDFMGATVNGGVYTKAQLLDFLKSGNEDIISMVGDELIVRVYGDAAVVTFRDTIKMRVEGKETTYLERYTDTWIKRDGRWQCVATHSSRIAQK